tara:strand:- start:161 stop:781 length:621 start_codon:yes stop_codon:yes gene_type:complete
MRIICCLFGDKFTQWHVDNLKHMIDTYSGLKYDSFEVITEDLYGNWYNKLQMYDKFRDGENLYFDLDMVISGELPNLIRKEFTLLDDTWWREEAHTPLNSSIVSWTGDVSHIWDKFKANDTYYLEKYNKGSDEFYYREVEYQTYDPVCPKINMEKLNTEYNICTLGQMHHVMEKGWSGWWSPYLFNPSSSKLSLQQSQKRILVYQI